MNRNVFKLAMKELDRVLGGGIVPGSLVLVGGDPGNWKVNIIITGLSEAC